MPPFKVVINSKEPGIFIVSLFGSLDTTTHESFEKEVEPLLTESTKAIVLNMEGVTYVSSLGIGAVFKVTNIINKLKGTLLLTNLQPQIKKVFETVKALPESIFTSIEEVDEYLTEIQKKALRKDKPSSL